MCLYNICGKLSIMWNCVFAVSRIFDSTFVLLWIGVNKNWSTFTYEAIVGISIHGSWSYNLLIVFIASCGINHLIKGGVVEWYKSVEEFPINLFLFVKISMVNENCNSNVISFKNYSDFMTLAHVLSTSKYVFLIYLYQNKFFNLISHLDSYAFIH